MSTCGDIGEEGILRLVRESLGQLPAPSAESARVLLGIGDDCAALSLAGPRPWLLTTDSLVEGVHFLRSQARPEDIGYKLLAVNASDLASKGAKPAAGLLSLALPAELPTNWLRAFLESLARTARECALPLVGGNTTRSPGSIVLSLSVLGEAPAPELKLRSNAREGDKLYVSGPLGDSRAGLRALQEGRSRKDNPWTQLIERHYRPPLRLREGAWLAARPEVHAMMDLSDGLASDLPRLLKASHLGAILNMAELPTTAALQEAAQLGGFAAHEDAFVGGEDYELLFAVAPDDTDVFESEYREAFGRVAHLIGRCTSLGEYRILDANKKPLSLGERLRGFEHF